MTDYGVQPTGFVRKPLSVVLAEIEAALITEFGPDVIQTPQSPLGQINGLMASAVTQIWELSEGIYQSYDPDQAEDTRLDILSRLRSVNRGAKTDAQLRQALTNETRSNVGLADFHDALLAVEGVEFAKVYSKQTTDNSPNPLVDGQVAVSVIGGDDTELANVVRNYVVPGITTYGNYPVETIVDGFCRTVYLLRPIEIECYIKIIVNQSRDSDCPNPSEEEIQQLVYDTWLLERENGMDLTYHAIRSIIESVYKSLEAVQVFTSLEQGVFETSNQPIAIDFLEIANLHLANIEVQYS